MYSRACLAVALLACLPGAVNAQDYRAMVQGIVTDPSQAVVVGAKVSLENSSTGVASSAVSNATGRYILNFVEPGMYRLSIEMAGFAKFVQQNLRVETRADITVNAVLTVGNAASSVTVSEEPPALEFNSATLSISASRQMVQELPVANRNPLTLALLNPAVVNSNGEGRGLAEGVNNVLQPMNFIFAGTRAGQLDIVVDGQSALIGPIDANNPSKDAVQEIVVQENTTDAEYGRSAGGVISLVSRTGTNQWHGDVQYTGKNPYLNAAQDIITHAPNPHRDHFWGATVGNPIRKNKLFTLNSYEGRRQILPFQQMSTMPTALERQGDFSQSLTFNGARRAIYDPINTVFNPSNNTSTRTLFPGNVIPSTRIDPTAARIMRYVWAPNNPGQNLAGLNNYAKNYGVQGKYVNFLNRTDWNVSDKVRVYGRVNATQATFAQDQYCAEDLKKVNPSAVGCIARADPTSGVSEQRGVTADIVYSLASTMFLDLRFNWGRVSSMGVSDTTDIGAQGMRDLWGGNNWFDPYVNPKVLPTVRFPAISFSGALNLGSASYWIRRGRDIDIVPKISWQHGRHYLKAGMELHRTKFDSFWPTQGTFTAAPADTANTFLNPNTANSGDPYATFLLGAVSGNFGVAAPLSLTQNFFAAYLQDDVKLTRRLTVNLGLRWEASMGLKDGDDQLTRMVDLASPIPALQANPAQMPAVVKEMLASTNARQDVTTGGMYFVGTNPNNVKQPHTLFYGGLRAFQPRVGLAFRLTNKTSVRFGYARWVLPPDRQTNIYSGTTANGQTIPVYGFSARSTMLPSLNGVPQSYLNDPFPK